ncbi:MAG: hypothetical protein KAX34_06490 [Aeromonas sp.]|nr:hypothetical protein [Aeromonas sp.]
MDEELTEKTMGEFLARWLLPEEAPEELAEYPMWGVACWLDLDYGGGRCVDAGRAYKTPDGHIVFADKGGWCTPYVRRWMPELDRGVGHVAARAVDAEE